MSFVIFFSNKWINASCFCGFSSKLTECKEGAVTIRLVAFTCSKGYYFCPVVICVQIQRQPCGTEFSVQETGQSFG